MDDNMCLFRLISIFCIFLAFLTLCNCFQVCWQYSNDKYQMFNAGFEEIRKPAITLRMLQADKADHFFFHLPVFFLAHQYYSQLWRTPAFWLVSSFLNRRNVLEYWYKPIKTLPSTCWPAGMYYLCYCRYETCFPFIQWLLAKQSCKQCS